MNSQIKSQRQLQIGEQIKRAIADIFMREGLSVMGGNYITILEADVSPDIKNVKIYVDIFGDSNKNERILDQLNQASGHFRFELGKRMSSRNTPEVSFILDRTQENAIRLEQLIDMESHAMSGPVVKPRSLARSSKSSTKTIAKSSAKNSSAKPRKKK